MALVPAICTQCGATIEVDNTKEAGICKFCGTPFVVEKAINNYNVTNVNNNTFTNSTVNFNSETELERLIGAAKGYEKLDDYNGASRTYYEITRRYPGDYRGWWGLVSSKFDGDFYNENPTQPYNWIEREEAYENVLKLVKGTNEEVIIKNNVKEYLERCNIQENKLNSIEFLKEFIIKNKQLQGYEDYQYKYPTEITLRMYKDSIYLRFNSGTFVECIGINDENVQYSQ